MVQITPMNSIQAFRMAQAAKQKSQQEGSNPTPTTTSTSLSPPPSLKSINSKDEVMEDVDPALRGSKPDRDKTPTLNSQNSNSVSSNDTPPSTSSLSKSAEIPPEVPSSSRIRPINDLRQRSLAMYKSINNMLAHPNDHDFAPLTKVSLEEVESVALDFVHTLMQAIGPVGPEEASLLYKVATTVLTKELEQAKKEEVTTTTTSQTITENENNQRVNHVQHNAHHSHNGTHVHFGDETHNGNCDSEGNSHSRNNSSSSTSGDNLVMMEIDLVQMEGTDDMVPVLKVKEEVVKTTTTTATIVDCIILKNILEKYLAPHQQSKREKLGNSQHSQNNVSVPSPSLSPSPILATTISRPSREVNIALGVEGYGATTQGSRKTMEDQYTIISHLSPLLGLDSGGFPTIAYYGVYDGHSGKAAAEYTRTHLHTNIFKNQALLDHFSKHPSTLSSSSNIMKSPLSDESAHLINRSLLEGYLLTNKRFNSIATRNSLTSGTTAVSCVVTNDKIFVANVGDSEAVLCRDGQALVVTTSHLPSKAAEKERITQAGGIVVCYGTWRVNGLLSVSRSIGDNSLDSCVIAEPDITELRRCAGDEFIVMATDGLWDVCNHQETCDFVREAMKNYPKHEISKLLIDEAIRKKSTDNVTAVIVFFNNEG